MVLRYWGPGLPNQRQVERQGQIMELSKLPETSENPKDIIVYSYGTKTLGTCLA